MMRHAIRQMLRTSAVLVASVNARDLDAVAAIVLGLAVAIVLMLMEEFFDALDSMGR